MRRGRALPALAVEADESPPYDGIRGRQRRLCVTPGLAAKLGVDASALVGAADGLFAEGEDGLHPLTSAPEYPDRT